MAINIGNKKCQLHIGNTKVSKIYLGSTKIYSSGSICTYICDDDTYQEEVDEGASCLSPKTFIPVKSGWEFVGWRQDTAANGSVLSSLAMGDAPITLYAVFRQTITLSYNGNSATSGSTAAQTGYRYYNNGNMANPSFTLSANGFSRTSYTFTKWALGSASGTQYAAGVNVTLAASTTMYAVWKASSVAVAGNSNYISINGDMTCGIWYKIGNDDDTSIITVNYSGYSKITIAFDIELSNVDESNYARISINGVSVLDSHSSKYPDYVRAGVYRYTATYTGVTKIPIVSHIQNYNSASSWTNMKISISSAVLSM